ncbi:MAG: 2'-5' RNA ligase family protein [Minisyncoccia bacterium]
MDTSNPSDKATGYSLWLEPSAKNPARQFLDEMVKVFSKEYNTPIFTPHVTLLGGIEGNIEDILAKTASLSARLHPFTVRLGEIISRGQYFQSFIAPVSQGKEIMNAGEQARTLFEIPREYFPHMSLAYGNFSEDQFMRLKEMAREADISGSTFLAESVHVYRTEGTVEEWEHIAEFQLESNPSKEE